MVKLRGLRTLCVASCLCLAAAASAAPTRAPSPQGATPPTADSVRLSTSGDLTRLVFLIDRPVSGVAYVLGDPDRVVVDLPEIRFRIDPRVGQPAAVARAMRKGLIGSFRFGQFAAGRSRIVIDLKRAARIVAARAQTLSDGREAFEIDVAPTSEAAFRAAAAAPPREAESLPGPARTTSADDTIPTVVIDPGHGGIDTGALGPPGVEEKNITLPFALLLAAKLKADGEVKPALTRAQDVFVPLEERVRIAEADHAALFVSIHADMVHGAPDVSGATVYTLSNRASDAQAAREAASENGADARGGLAAQDSTSRDQVKTILFDLARRESHAYSNLFAQTLMRYWSAAAPLNRNPHRSAGFVVLKAPDIPSVLLEMGYLSSRRDVRDLTNPKWRERAAASVAHAIEAYFAARKADVALSDPTQAPEGAVPPPPAPAP